MIPQVDKGDLLQLGALIEGTDTAPSASSQPLLLTSLFDDEEIMDDMEDILSTQVQAPSIPPSPPQLRLLSNNPEEEGDHISYMRGQY